MRVFHWPSSFHFFTLKILGTTNTQQVEDMARIQPISIDKAPAPLKTAFFNHIAEYKTHITNTKATLGHSLPAFEAYMQWYPLYEQVQRLLGARLASLYAFAISEASHSPLCSTFFRKIIIDAGEEPDHLELSPEEQLLLDFGATIAREKGQMPLEKGVEGRCARAFKGKKLAQRLEQHKVQAAIQASLVGALQRRSFHHLAKRDARRAGRAARCGPARRRS